MTLHQFSCRNAWPCRTHLQDRPPAGRGHPASGSVTLSTLRAKEAETFQRQQPRQVQGIRRGGVRHREERSQGQ